MFVHSLDLSTRELCYFVLMGFPYFKGGSTPPFNTIEVETLKNGVISLVGRTSPHACLFKSKFTLQELELQGDYPLGRLLPLKSALETT